VQFLGRELKSCRDRSWLDMGYEPEVPDSRSSRLTRSAYIRGEGKSRSLFDVPGLGLLEELTRSQDRALAKGEAPDRPMPDSVKDFFAPTQAVVWDDLQLAPNASAWGSIGPIPGRGFTRAETRLFVTGLRAFGEKRMDLVRTHFLPTRGTAELETFFRHKSLDRTSDNAVQAYLREAVAVESTLLRFTPREDELLRQGVAELGKLWVAIVDKYLPHRSRLEVRKRWECLEAGVPRAPSPPRPSHPPGHLSVHSPGPRALSSARLSPTSRNPESPRPSAAQPPAPLRDSLPTPRMGAMESTPKAQRKRASQTGSGGSRSHKRTPRAPVSGKAGEATAGNKRRQRGGPVAGSTAFAGSDDMADDNDGGWYDGDDYEREGGDSPRFEGGGFADLEFTNTGLGHTGSPTSHSRGPARQPTPTSGRKAAGRPASASPRFLPSSRGGPHVGRWFGPPPSQVPAGADNEEDYEKERLPSEDENGEDEGSDDEYEREDLAADDDHDGEAEEESDGGEDGDGSYEKDRISSDDESEGEGYGSFQPQRVLSSARRAVAEGAASESHPRHPKKRHLEPLKPVPPPSRRSA
jgi:hypothetical protein